MAGAAELDNKIYISGGGDPILQTKTSVKCYDLNTNTWSYVAKMNTPRSGHCLVSIYGRLYAIGGQNVDSIEVYDPENNTWTLLQHKMEGRIENTAACLAHIKYGHFLRGIIEDDPPSR